MGATILSDSSFALPVSAVTDDFAIGLAFSGQPFYIDLEDVVLGYTDSSQQYYALSIYAADIPDSFGNNIVLVSRPCMTPLVRRSCSARRPVTLS